METTTQRRTRSRNSRTSRSSLLRSKRFQERKALLDGMSRQERNTFLNNERLAAAERYYGNPPFYVPVTDNRTLLEKLTGMVINTLTSRNVRADGSPLTLTAAPLSEAIDAMGTCELEDLYAGGRSLRGWMPRNQRERWNAEDHQTSYQGLIRSLEAKLQIGGIIK